MLTTLKNAFKIKEIRQKILFTLGMLVVIRIGSQLPVPGVDTKFFSQWFAQQTGGAFSFFDAITGGSFLNMSILALNINPYITSSIIMQLLTIAIPKLEEMQRDGEDGRKKNGCHHQIRYRSACTDPVHSNGNRFWQTGLLDRVQRSECNYHDHSTYRW